PKTRFATSDEVFPIKRANSRHCASIERFQSRRPAQLSLRFSRLAMTTVRFLSEAIDQGPIAYLGGHTLSGRDGPKATLLPLGSSWFRDIRDAEPPRGTALLARSSTILRWG